MKQFGDRAMRVSTEEMEIIYHELNKKVGLFFCGFELTLTLEEKTNHGDVDILVLLHPEQDVRSIIESLNPLEYNRNGHCHSFLYDCKLLKSPVHVDFLVSGDPNNHRTKRQYYAFNNLSAIVGIMAKSLNFKYGTEGFFKRYKDKRNNYHDILISVDLNPGLQCLGLEPKPIWIKTNQDIVDYVSSSLLFSSEMYKFVLEDPDLQPKRTDLHLSYAKLANLGKLAAIAEEDYFFKRQFPSQYEEVEGRKKEIEDSVYRMSRFSGAWLIKTFNMKPGPEIGKMLKLISDNFEDLLDTVEEELVIEFVKMHMERSDVD